MTIHIPGRAGWLVVLATAFLNPTALAAPAQAGWADGTGGCDGRDRGRLTAVTDLPAITRADVAAQLQASGLASDAVYGVDRYRLTYCTVSPAGAATVASGLLLLPHGATGALPMVSYEHGTNSARTEAPSFLGTTEGTLAPLVFGAVGFAVSAPDYLGLGLSAERHPYLQARTEASASVDMLRAATVATARLHTRLSRDLFVSGHSQGGHATMALGQELERDPAGWRLRALAPMAGPYDLSGTALPVLLDPALTNPAVAPVYLAYLLTAWQHLYGLYADQRQIFLEPYADTVTALFDGTHGITEVEAALTALDLVFRPEVLSRLPNPTGRLLEALRDNDVCQWRPTVPTRLYAGRADTDVPFAHAEQCQLQIAAHDGHADLIDLGPVDHVGTALTALPMIRDWFLTLD
jgi:hypothetical protein